jgi:hypothetical protein
VTEFLVGRGVAGGSSSKRRLAEPYCKRGATSSPACRRDFRR